MVFKLKIILYSILNKIQLKKINLYIFTIGIEFKLNL